MKMELHTNILMNAFMRNFQSYPPVSPIPTLIRDAAWLWV